MRALNVVLCVVVSLLLAAGVLEIGLRVIGMGPTRSIHRFDPDLGWSKEPGARLDKETREFSASFEINELGLRDDPMSSPQKTAGTKRVLMLGDSFVLGYTVERKDLFVDLLEHWWKDEGRALDVINAGTEGYSTDQEVVWFEKHGARFAPDLVVLFPYENDLYWNSQPRYLRYPKPRFSVAGPREKIVLQDPGATSAFERLALGKLIAGFGMEHLSWSPNGTRKLPMEHAAYWHDAPDFMREAHLRTKSALAALKSACATLGVPLVVAPIPGKAAIEPKAHQALIDMVQNRGPIASLSRKLKGGTDPAQDPKLETKAWSPDQPVDTFLTLCQELEIPALDARQALQARARELEAKGANERSLYYQTDWHFNPEGNRTFAAFLHDALEPYMPLPATRTSARPAIAADEKHVPTWPFVFAGLWIALGTLFKLTYPSEPVWKVVLGVGVMLGMVFTIAIGGFALLGKLPPQWAQLVTIAIVLGIATFVLIKLGRRLGTIAELLLAFTRRGHWYLMPLIVILLSIGSLLVVAASSPLVAPFIYTLF